VNLKKHHHEDQQGGAESGDFPIEGKFLGEGH